MSEQIEVITLSRGVAAEDGPWVAGGGHRVHATWPLAEREVKARVLRTLSERIVPPDGVAFVRQWEPAQDAAQVPTVRPAFTPPTAPAVPSVRGKRGR